MATIQSVIRGDVVAACRTPAVASSASVASSLWADAAAPRVFQGIQGYMGGRNRGRLPFLEIACGETRFSDRNSEGGIAETSIVIRCHCGGKDQSYASDLTASILQTCLAQLRDSSVVTYMSDGDNSLASLVAGPWGFMRDATLTVRHTFGDDYGVN